MIRRTKMTQIDTVALSAQSQIAAEWVARLSGQPAESDWLAFEQWLNGGGGRRAAYDRALSLSLSIDQHGAALADLMDRAPAPRSNRPQLAWGAGLLALAAVAVTFTALHPRPQPKAQVYATAKGERRNVVLADGTRVALNAGTSLSVIIERDRRELALASGEAAFQVTHDPARPFILHVGDRVLRDVGTEFDVLREGGKIAVTVREGMVSVRRSRDDPRELSMGPGSHLENIEGSPVFVVLATNADEAFAWRAGRLIYRNRPLSEVAADLSRYGEQDIRVSGSAAEIRFSGVLTIDNQKAMVKRLTGLLPVVASTRNDGVLLISELESAR